jgi:hypothetical protein
MNIIAYDIHSNLEHIPKRPKRGDVEKYDALIYPEGSINEWSLIETVPYDETESINFLGWLNRLPATDFPHNKPGLLLMSKKMLEALCSVGSFPHGVIPARIFSYDLEYNIDEYLYCKNLDSSLCNENFVVVQLLEYLDVVDQKRSTFRSSPAFPNDPPEVDELVFRELSGDFPPLFRVNGYETYVFASPQAKQALDKAGIKGIKYFAWDKDGSAGWVYKMPDGTEQIGNPVPSVSTSV